MPSWAAKKWESIVSKTSMIARKCSTARRRSAWVMPRLTTRSPLSTAACVTSLATTQSSACFHQLFRMMIADRSANLRAWAASAFSPLEIVI